MKRRKNKEGSYGTKKINGIMYKTYSAPNHEWTVYAKTAKELEEKRKNKEKEQKEKENLAKTPSVLYMDDIFGMWLKDVRKRISERTFDDYERIVNKNVRGDEELKNTQASGLTLHVLNKFFEKLKDKYAKGTIDKIWVMVKQSVEFGQKKKYIPQSLDLSEVIIPSKNDVKKEGRVIYFITPEDMELLYEEARRKNNTGSYYYGRGALLLIFIMYSGVRLGEGIGLRWMDVAHDLSEVTIRVSNTMVKKRDKDGNPVIENGHSVYELRQKSPKTESGEDRVIPLPERGREVLKEMGSLYPNHKPKDNVFLSQENTPFDKRNIQRLLSDMLNNSGCHCKDYTPHSLRHGYGSILLSRGVDIKIVSKLLGHKRVSTTYNIYIHVLKDDAKKAVMNVFDSKNT